MEQNQEHEYSKVQASENIAFDPGSRTPVDKGSENKKRQEIMEQYPDGAPYRVDYKDWHYTVRLRKGVDPNDVDGDPTTNNMNDNIIPGPANDGEEAGQYRDPTADSNDLGHRDERGQAPYHS